METKILQKKDNLATFITKDFKEAVENEISYSVDSWREVKDIHFYYKDFLIDAQVTIYSRYYNDTLSNGWTRPDESGWEFESQEVENIFICYKDDDTALLNDVERLAIEKYLSIL